MKLHGAKGHFNPATKPHGYRGGIQCHAVDMQRRVADNYGNASLSAELDGLALTECPGGILNRSVAIRADPDDYESQPVGNSGKRVAWG